MLRLGDKKVGKLYLGDKAVKKCYLGDSLVYSSKPPIPATLNDCSWELISQLSESGEFANYFSVGDTKTIILNGKIGNGFTANNLAINLVVAGIDHNAELESPGEHRIHFMLGISGNKFISLVDNLVHNSVSTTGYFSMNATNTNSGGWNGSQMRANIMPDLKNALQEDLKAVMKSVQKYTDNVGGKTNNASNVTATTEYICPFAEFEVFGERALANSAEQTKQSQYQLYKNVVSKRPYIYNLESDTISTYLRSPSIHYDTNFCYISATGFTRTDSARLSAGLSALLFV